MRLSAPLLFSLVILIGGSAVFCSNATAALGEKETSIETDRQALSANTTSGTHLYPGYTVREITSDSVVVREYLNKDGVVFGLAWKGINTPDLSALLGKYYGEYQESFSRRGTRPHSRGGHNTFKGSHVVVERSGHMRAVKGRAYVPELLPSGLKPNEIK